MWTITYQNINKDLKNVVAHKIVFCTSLTDGNAQWIMDRYLDYC